MIALILSTVLFLPIVYLLFVPIKLVLNSEETNFYVHVPGIIKVMLVQTPETILSVRIKVLFFKPRTLSGNSKNTTARTKNFALANGSTSSLFKELPVMFNLVKKAVKVKNLEANMDTGDFPLNAQLIPVAQSINNQHIHVNINFKNTNNINALIITRVSNILILFLKLKTHKRRTQQNH